MFKKLSILFVAAAAAFGAQAELPSVQLKDINDNTINTAELSNNGKPMVISFFATWCKPCLRELKAISEVYPEWQDETGMKLVAVSIDEAQNAQKVKPLIEGKGWDYEVLLDVNGEFKRQMGVTDIPHVFIVDGNGNVVWNHKGYIDGGEEEIIAKIKEITK